MGQKINPIGYRLGISRDWQSRWYAPSSSYADVAHEDIKIRKYLKKKLEMAGLKEVDIERTENDISITVRVSKPGVVIGRGGTGVEEIEKEIKKLTKAKVKITAEEVKSPEMEAQLVGDYLARQIKRRMPYRRVVKFALSGAMDKGAKGIKIRLSGVLSGSNTISRSEQYTLGSIPLQTLRAEIDYAQIDCHLLYGTIGIKVWIYKGEKTI
ncbi:MAG: 30S ribosomal protein S3 [candidate division WWE3 bacterium GW2011_GWF2_41_45]|uniref:Small ribosomal subunit protein uS3 n=3 Tax=Katanobacteria TaxID=422282 RepID=A0A1F4W3I8_UNCKA|nr:MAG: 30S ribosomal protein S3 [candidate division WWE3 bacterium GW2011_GWC2_41_23]KKS10757.1 MAG: 30S ribosomal protein S3 [candidate division WWE3 bacterium GW2011_GWF2_41_45]KKS12433.1 MAG: 30S ribosomal protein S3 [candidate division WWE3 bacterium GW2011_GWF1_41_53]KKS20188.1 MAG: 30S ribosomal protein S3 [candidate division WWE3 bacterium GW2011_GWE1_41_72]KKS28374.1 MAG: 30S ribosomal protein S3 [candidate division WWE3 bacterium GW2011_GWC1_42_102]KKS29595.1 MAG: 30S ribosomal prote